MDVENMTDGEIQLALLRDVFTPETADRLLAEYRRRKIAKQNDTVASLLDRAARILGRDLGDVTPEVLAVAGLLSNERLGDVLESLVALVGELG